MQNENTCGCRDMREIKSESFENFPKAMAYVPWQNFNKTIGLSEALQVGTIFPELYQPFCGRRGKR